MNCGVEEESPENNLEIENALRVPAIRCLFLSNARTGNALEK